jgi:hypothetical protein
VVAVEDAGVAHRVSAHTEHVLTRVATGERGHLDVLLDVLLGQHGRAGGNAADDGQATRAHGLLRLVDEQLEGARLGRIAPQEADLLEVREVRVDGRRRGQADRLADVADGRRVPVLGRVALDELEDLLLTLGQVQVHGCEPPEGRFPNMCS